ncbi:MAG: stage V sporulation protein AD [Lachnospiraceae bacterium]|nr:stage V sporulation protein AD [Lachnospiraceae bacterium]
MKKGKASLFFENDVFIEHGASVVGSKEGDGPLGHLFDVIESDAMVGEDSWEKAESMIQSKAVEKLMEKSGVTEEEIRYILGGDLLGQLIATTFGVKKYNIPLIGLYGACSTMGEGLGVGGVLISSGCADKVIALASSHFASAEKTFRFPLEYANQRPYSATWTVTGCGAVLLTNKKSEKTIAKIKGITTGKVVDFGLKDSQNMGACMAPAAADTICRHFEDFDTSPKDYDKIITGDLGVIGQKILIDLLKDKGYDISSKHMDCGIEIFDANKQDTHAGGSGCGCSATVLTSLIFRQLKNGQWKKILFIPTGALMSPVSFNEGLSVPGIAHLVSIEAV